MRSTLKFLRVIDYVAPANQRIQMIADNYAHTDIPKVERWLSRHPPSPCALHGHWLLVAEHGRALLPRVTEN